MTFKAGGAPATALHPDLDGLSVSLANLTGTVFSETLPASAFVRNAAGTRWRISAVRDGGIYDFSLVKRVRTDGTTIYAAKVRLDADLSAADPSRSNLALEALAWMTLSVSSGDDTLTAAGPWEPLRTGWRTRDDELAAGYVGPARRVFVSSACYPGSLGGLGGADEKCQSLADDAGLGGAFTAWLSDAYDGPAVRLPHASVPFVLVDASVIARDWDDLVDGAIARPILLDEAGTTVDGDCGARVWTNTSPIGLAAVSDALEFACYEWTLALFSRWGLLGDATATDATWTDGGALAMQRCSSTARLYCFER